MDGYLVVVRLRGRVVRVTGDSEGEIEQLHEIERRHRNKWRDTLEEGDELGSAYHRGYIDGLARAKKVIRDE